MTSRSDADLATRLAALEEAARLASGRLDPVAVAAAERVVAKASDRLRLSAGHTVVALAGATGSGKSSLFNALVGAPVSEVGMRRPTTGTAHAGVWDDGGAPPLLDWLQISRRHLREPSRNGERPLDGLVLLDLPDFDSTQTSHRVEVDRLVELVDLLVWVLDPQKYADAAVHERYLRPLARHDEVMLVLLNQADRLTEVERASCLADLRALLDREGLERVPVLAVSARTEDGLPELRRRLAEQVVEHRAAVARLAADVRAAADQLADRGCGPDGDRTRRSAGRARSRDRIRPGDRDRLVEALTEAAGADLVVAAVVRSHRLQARSVAGWPLTRWVGRLRPDPMRRLRLRATPDELVRTSLPGPSAVQRARVDSALRDLGEHAAAELPDPWPQLVRRAGTEIGEDLPELLDRTVAGADLSTGRRPRWWRLAGVLQVMFTAAAVLGALWLLALFGLDYLRLPDPPLPHVGRVPVPTLLLAGGLLAGALLSVLARWLASIGARRRGRVVRRRLRERVERLAAERVLDPIARELAVHSELCASLARARS